MTAWAQGKHQQYQIPSETARFAKVALAVALHEADEQVLDRQDPEWITDLRLMLRAQGPQSLGQQAQGIPAALQPPAIPTPPPTPPVAAVP